jgi:hypothetical protein
MNDNERAHCATLAALLRAEQLAGWWGFALSVVAALVLALTVRALSMTATMGFGAVAVLGVLERYFAFRLRFDERLFGSLAAGTLPTLRALDAALAALGLRATPESERTVADRVAGTRQLMQRHLVVVACQSAMFLLALMTEDLR